ncbi:MAG: hypothetical protein WCT39_02385, partial [Candidatus Margulisiibacteriota bacterium]
MSNLITKTRTNIERPILAKQNKPQRTGSIKTFAVTFAVSISAHLLAILAAVSTTVNNLISDYGILAAPALIAFSIMAVKINKYRNALASVDHLPEQEAKAWIEQERLNTRKEAYEGLEAYDKTGTSTIDFGFFLPRAEYLEHHDLKHPN